jgi:hypothetical protein
LEVADTIFKIKKWVFKLQKSRQLDFFRQVINFVGAEFPAGLKPDLENEKEPLDVIRGWLGRTPFRNAGTGSAYRVLDRKPLGIDSKGHRV